MRNLLFYTLLAVLLSYAPSLTAQVGEGGGPIVDIELVPVCDDGTTAFQVLQYVIGADDPTLIGYVDAAGADYTLSGGTLTAGFCSSDGPTAIPQHSVSIQPMCDDGTQFYRVYVYISDASATVTDFALDLSTAYTPSGTVSFGNCVTTTNATISRTVATSTGSITAGAFSFEICNEGTTDGSVTMNSVASTIIPGSCVKYSAVYNPATRQYRLCPAVSYDGTNTSLVVVVEN